MNEQSYTKFLRNFYRTHCIYSSGAKNSRTVRVFTKNYMQSGNCVEWRKSLERERCCSTFETIAKSVFKEEKIEDAIVIFFTRKNDNALRYEYTQLTCKLSPAYLDNILRFETNTLDLKRFLFLTSFWRSEVRRYCYI